MIKYDDSRPEPVPKNLANDRVPLESYWLGVYNFTTKILYHQCFPFNFAKVLTCISGTVMSFCFSSFISNEKNES